MSHHQPPDPSRSTGADPATSRAPARLGVVVVGTGMIANAHLAALRSHPGAKVRGLVDTHPGRGSAAALANGAVDWTTDLDEALAWPGCDAVIVCTPNVSHAPIARRALAAGKHVLMEKPLTITVGDALELQQGFAEAGLVLAAAHTHRAYDYSRSVMEVIEAGRIGTPQVIRLTILGGWIWGDWRAWVMDPNRSGGHPLHNGVHLLDTVTWWMGERPTSVYARGQRQTQQGIGIDDHLEMTLRFPGGRFAVCEMSRGHRPATTAVRELSVIGSSGTLDQPAGADGVAVLSEAGPSAIPPLASDGFARQLTGWVEAINGTGAPLADADDGVFAVAMGVAATESIRTGREVALAEVLQARHDSGVTASNGSEATR